MLREFLAEQGVRVSEAIAFAEVLVPMLSDRLSAAQTFPARQAPGGPGVRRARDGSRGEAPGIADFIDEMLAQDRPARS